MRDGFIRRSAEQLATRQDRQPPVGQPRTQTFRQNGLSSTSACQVKRGRPSHAFEVEESVQSVLSVFIALPSPSLI